MSPRTVRKAAVALFLALGIVSIGVGGATLVNLATQVKGLLSPANGGTGVANNSAATFTRSGNHALTLTTTGTTNVTLPTTGTLMTLDQVETVTGAKTFGSAGAVGKLKVAGTTSGSTIIDATAVAGSGTVTLPTTGTLATLAGSEALTGKTYNGLTVTTSTGTLTIPNGTTVAYEEGSYTATLAVGCTTTPTASVRYTRIGKNVTLTMAVAGAFTCTSNSTSARSITGMNASLQPSAITKGIFSCSNNGGAYVPCVVSIATNGTMSVGATLSNNAWTNTGTQDIDIFTISYAQ